MYVLGTGSRLPDSSGSWRIPLALQIIPASILAIGILFFPFSPRWLISKGRELDALAALIKIRSTSSSEVQDELNEIKNEFVLEHEKQIQSYMQLVRRRLILGMGIQFLQQLTGINAVMYYAPEIFNQAGLADEHASLIATGINGCVNVLATIPAILFIDILGRRVLLISGAIIMSLSMFTIGGVMGTYGYKEVNATTSAVSVIIPNQAASYAIIVFVYIFVAGFAFSWGPITPIYCTEMFPLTMRAKGTSVTTAANWAANCVVSFIAPVLLDRITFGTYILFGVFCVIMGILTFLFYPETKGRSLEEMDQVFNRFVPLRLLSRRTKSVDKMVIDPSLVVIFKKNDFTTMAVENPLRTSLNRLHELSDNTGVPEVIIKRTPKMSSDIAYHSQ
jgi:sugar porter (SP) family MFS transporter